MRPIQVEFWPSLPASSLAPGIRSPGSLQSRGLRLDLATSLGLALSSFESYVSYGPSLSLLSLGELDARVE